MPRVFTPPSSGRALPVSAPPPRPRAPVLRPDVHGPEVLADPRLLGRVDSARSPSVRFPKLAKLIDSAHRNLALHLVHLRDADTIQRLIDAEARGVQVSLVVTAKDRLSKTERFNLLLLEGAGVDVVVRTKTQLPPRSGMVDGSAFTHRARTGEVEVSPSPALAARASEAFGEALVTRAVIERKGLLAPGRVLFHPMPEATAAPILNAIQSAKKSIDLEVYQLSEPSVVAALEAAAARGVKVRVMLEPKTVEAGNYTKMAARLSAAGISVKPTPPRFDSNKNVDHAKIMLVDDAEVLIGTGNLVRSGLGGNDRPEANNRDFWVEDSRAESLSEARKLFDSDWSRKNTSTADFQHLVVTPENDEPKIFGLMDAAKDRLLVYNQALSDEETIAHLLAAKARGVKVRVLLGVQPGPNGHPKNEPAAKKLRAAGIEVEYMTAHYLHAKGVISDDTAFLGSQNFTDGGLERNREVGVILTSKKAVAVLATTFESDFALAA